MFAFILTMQRETGCVVADACVRAADQACSSIFWLHEIMNFDVINEGIGKGKGAMK